MTADLDHRLTDTLHRVASTTTISDDAYDSIVARATRPPRRKRPSRRALITSATILAATAGAGVAAAAMVNRLTSDQADTIAAVPTCGVDTEDAKLVASTSGFGMTVDYWIVDGPDQYGDFLFVDGSDRGTGGCGGMSRAELHPSLPWVNYAFDTPVDQRSLFWFYGQAPAGAAEIQIVMNTGSTRAPISTDDGHFVVLAELPLNGVDRLERIDAFAADGTLIANHVEPPTTRQAADPAG
jgi:hypothetical protein